MGHQGRQAFIHGTNVRPGSSQMPTSLPHSSQKNAESDRAWTVPTRVTEAPSSNLYPQGSCPLKHLTLLPKVPHMATTTNDRLAGRMAGRGRGNVPRVRGGE